MDRKYNIRGDFLIRHMARDDKITKNRTTEIQPKPYYSLFLLTYKKSIYEEQYMYI